MSHPHSALQIYQFLFTLHENCSKETFSALLLSFKTPRFTSVMTLIGRWTPTLAAQAPQVVNDFQQLITSAARSQDYDQLLMRVADHYWVIYRVSCFLENDLQFELFVRCLCLDSTTPVSKKEVKETLLQFLCQLPIDSRDYVGEILSDDHHGYLTREDVLKINKEEGQMSGYYEGFLDLDRVYEIMNDPNLFDQFMAIIQTNTARQIPWSQTIQEIYELTVQKGIWDQLAPLLQQVYVNTDTTEYSSYEDYVQKNFLDDGGQAYLDEEIKRVQVEHMMSKLSM
ncbi:uncharacterized protein BX663DRAFT_517763 [Cokeromyces recurvatus]|uniref:uncharacterized protein n=1 Tax=Cokeromyces recurvatus TaxID=90255 RepID=UPI0022203A6E|nr:uncharacterized protein BX663DRAFT_517763 [Cokeromyces recurvatus]KAI7900469.1 hypothetical protein BX663DRAFT_517763 [Cokeromyces recurvatus]